MFVSGSPPDWQRTTIAIITLYRDARSLSLSLSLVGSQEVAASVTQLQLCGEKGEERKALSVMETRQY